jgi:SPP1 family predicted phage head-tail adaptor
MKCPCLGDLTEALIVQRWMQSSETTSGGQNGEWVTAYEPLADIERKWGSERWMSQQMKAIKWADIIITYNPQINETMRCLIDNVSYNIRSVIPDKKRLWLFIKAECGVPT